MATIAGRIMHVEIAHQLSQDQIRTVAQQAAQHYSERFAAWQPVIRWLNVDEAEVHIRVKGVDVAGRVRLTAKTVVFDARVPWLLRPLIGRAEQVVRRQLAEWTRRVQAKDPNNGPCP